MKPTDRRNEILAEFLRANGGVIEGARPRYPLGPDGVEREARPIPDDPLVRAPYGLDALELEERRVELRRVEARLTSWVARDAEGRAVSVPRCDLAARRRDRPLAHCDGYAHYSRRWSPLREEWYWVVFEACPIASAVARIETEERAALGVADPTPDAWEKRLAAEARARRARSGVDGDNLPGSMRRLFE